MAGPLKIKLIVLGLALRQLAHELPTIARHEYRRQPNDIQVLRIHHGGALAEFERRRLLGRRGGDGFLAFLRFRGRFSSDLLFRCAWRQRLLAILRAFLILGD